MYQASSTAMPPHRKGESSSKFDHYMNWRWKIDKNKGGLNVRHLKKINLVLLGKWCRRLMVNGKGLYYMVLDIKKYIILMEM